MKPALMAGIDLVVPRTGEQVMSMNKPNPITPPHSAEGKPQEAALQENTGSS
jgi:hypothetical protein